MVYTDEQVDILVTLNIIASSFSFIGACFIIANYFAFKEFRNFAFKLILFVAVGDVLNSLGNFMGSPQDGSFWCYLQAFITQFGDIVSFAWVTSIAFVIYSVINRETQPTGQQVQKWYKNIHLVIWPTTLCLSILPFFSGSYGNDDGLCWISVYPNARANPWGAVWQWICFYLPLLGSIAFVATVYYRIWGQLTAPDVSRKPSDATAEAPNASKGDEAGTGDSSPNLEVDPQPKESHSDVYHAQQHSSNLDVLGSSGDLQPSAEDVTKKESSGMMQRIKFYPFVLFGCYCFAFVRRIAEFIAEDNVAPFGIAAIQVFTSALLGTCNAILYGFTPMVYRKDSEWVRSKWRECCGGDKNAKDGNEEDIR